MERFFPADRIILTGNPVRQDLTAGLDKKEEAYQYFKFSPSKKTILIVGGSLGARTINHSVMAFFEQLAETDIQVIWQTGKIYINDALKEVQAVKKETSNILVTDFVSRMDLAYSIADLVISRAGASSISELCLLKKPVILVPSPNVAEDHQTKNALALASRDAALMITDADAPKQLIPVALDLIQNEAKLKSLAENIEKLAQYDSAARIADEILKLIK
jgi:UDP-N-acetylglucosamine--N-acetylmuramyl-(pentapeptide) pyrophosphoryl-undecaprenol N-acetylglucosamine transferase